MINNYWFSAGCYHWGISLLCLAAAHAIAAGPASESGRARAQSRGAALRVPGQPSGHRRRAAPFELDRQPRPSAGSDRRCTRSWWPVARPFSSSDQGDLWDSGQVKSDDTTAVVYEGKPLVSNQRCYWKVKVWDKEDKPSEWSTPALWSMGLLQSADWKAEWIGNDKPRDALKADPSKLVLPPPSYLRTNFPVSKPVKHATLYSTALGIHDLHLNGQSVSDDYFNPGWTDYTRRVYYRAYDVTRQIHAGENALGAILADGWYSGYVGFGKLRDHYGKHTRLKAQLHIEYADGSTEIVATGPGWKAATGPITEADFLMGETYDARAGPSGLGHPGFR